MKLKQAIDRANQILLGKNNEVSLAICCLLARGHLLIEDVPGVGKTILAETLARIFGLQYSRIQFTSDLLPADILGSTIFNPSEKEFKFHPGPLFGELILADELNRATPKTQSALLQAMEEGMVTTDGKSHQLPNPFFVVATQNPRNQVGTFPLPESQLDRFLMKIEIGFPDRESEHELLTGGDQRARFEQLKPLLSKNELIQIQSEVDQVHTSKALIHYVQDILEYTRNHLNTSHGVSPRGGLALLQAARAWAFLQGREHVIPEDVQAVAPTVIEHRVGSKVALEVIRSVNVDIAS